MRKDSLREGNQRQRISSSTRCRSSSPPRNRNQLRHTWTTLVRLNNSEQDMQNDRNISRMRFIVCCLNTVAKSCSAVDRLQRVVRWPDELCLSLKSSRIFGVAIVTEVAFRPNRAWLPMTVVEAIRVPTGLLLVRALPVLCRVKAVRRSAKFKK